MLRFAGTTLALIALLATLVVGAGCVAAGGGVPRAARASALGDGSWVAWLAQPHRMAASANTVFFMLLSLVLVGKDPLWRKSYLRKCVACRLRGTIRG